jgi:hypothetical protein
LTNKAWDALAIVSKAARMELKHPVTDAVIRDKEGKAAYIDLYSADDPVADDVRRELYDDVMAPQSKRNKNKPRLTMEEARASQAKLLACLTENWYLVDPRTGDPLNIPFSFEKAIEIYGDQRVAWIKEQADDFANDRANFF